MTKEIEDAIKAAIKATMDYYKVSKDELKNVDMKNLEEKINDSLGTIVVQWVSHDNALQLKDQKCPKCNSKNIDIQQQGTQFTERHWTYDVESDNLDCSEEEFIDYQGDPTCEFECVDCGFSATIKGEFDIGYGLKQ